MEVRAALTDSAPFDTLPALAIDSLAESSRIAEYEPGALILDAFRATPRDVFIVISGTVDLWVDPNRSGGTTGSGGPGAGAPPDEKAGPGQVFGLDATLTGKAIGPLAVAAGPVRLVRVPADRVERALISRPTAADPPVQAFSGDAPHLSVDSLIATPPVFVSDALTVRETALAMEGHGLDGLAAVELPDGTLGIVTDRSLRRRIVAAGLPPDTPVAAAALTDLPRVFSGTPATEALILLLDTRADYVLVMSRDQRLLGVIDSSDVNGSSGTTGVALHQQFHRAGNVEELQRLAQGMPGLVAEQLDGGLSPAAVLSVYSAMVDSVIRRTLALVFEEHPDLSLDAFTWLSLGSNGRRETTLSSDVDSAATFADSVSQAEIDQYRLVFREVTSCLAGAGLTTDDHGATAAHRIFARTGAGWRSAAHDWLADPTRNNAAMMTSLMVDARPIHGNPGVPDVSRIVASDLHHNLGSMRLLLEESLARRARIKPRLLFVGSEKFDIKANALQPIVNLARWAGLSVGSSTLTTRDRLRAAAGSAILPQRQAATLTEIFEVLQAIRLRHQLRQLDAGARPSDEVELDRMSGIDRSIITRAVREIASVQNRVDNVSRYADARDWNRPESPGPGPPA